MTVAVIAGAGSGSGRATAQRSRRGAVVIVSDINACIGGTWWANTYPGVAGGQIAEHQRVQRLEGV